MNMLALLPTDFLYYVRSRVPPIERLLLVVVPWRRKRILCRINRTPGLCDHTMRRTISNTALMLMRKSLFVNLLKMQERSVFAFNTQVVSSSGCRFQHSRLRIRHNQPLVTGEAAKDSHEVRWDVAGASAYTAAFARAVMDEPCCGRNQKQSSRCPRTQRRGQW